MRRSLRTGLVLGLSFLAAALTALAQDGTNSMTARVEKVTGEAIWRTGTGSWQDAQPGQRLLEKAELSTGVESQVTIAFSDGSAMVVKELTQIRVAKLLKAEDRLKVEVQLRLGQIKAQVKHQETLRTNFSIQTPTATASVRGTEINEVSYYPPVGTTTRLGSGQLLVEGLRGRVLTSGTDEARVDPELELVTPQNVIEEGSRTHVEPAGITTEERQQINDTNQPSSIIPLGTTVSNRTDPGATLIFRFALQ